MEDKKFDEKKYYKENKFLLIAMSATVVSAIVSFVALMITLFG